MAPIRDDLDAPLFRPVAKDHKTLLRKYLDRSAIWEAVKRNARKASLDPDRVGRRGSGAHSLRKTAITTAIENGAHSRRAHSTGAATRRPRRHPDHAAVLLPVGERKRGGG